MKPIRRTTFELTLLCLWGGMGAFITFFLPSFAPIDRLIEQLLSYLGFSLDPERVVRFLFALAGFITGAAFRFFGFQKQREGEIED